MMPLRRGRDGFARIDRVRWWPGSKQDRRAHAVTFTSKRRQVMIRFGRDEWVGFNERYDGQFGRPRRYWHGPLGLTLRIVPIRESSSSEASDRG